MLSRLPLDSYQWLSTEELRNFDLEHIDTQSEEGYILEVDLDYPEGK